MAAKGQVAEAMAGADGVEIKATIADHQVEDAMRLYGLQKDDNERYIYFFDTPELELFEAGIIGRARRVIGGKHDSTIKFRPVDPATVPKKWQMHEGFKIEADASEKGVVKSASLTKPVEKGLIKRVLAGRDSVTSLFTQEQQIFLLSLANHRFDFDKVKVLGPIQTWRWKFTDPGLPWPITAELWKRDDGDLLCEASIKVPLVQAAAATAGFKAFLAEVGAELDRGEQAKTRWSLEFYSKKHR